MSDYGPHLASWRVAAGESAIAGRQARRLPVAVTAALAIDIAAALLLGVFMRHAGDVSASLSPQDAATPAGLVWLRRDGPGGGGGGGGNRMTTPPTRVARPGHDALTVPVAPPRTFEPSSLDRSNDAGVVIPAQPLASALQSLPGTLDAVDTSTRSLGPGSGPGAGTGVGPGIGPDRGAGLGPGSVEGAGGGVYQQGNGVTNPVAIFQAKPQYTADAMRARVQGSVVVQCAVLVTGQCSDIRVVRSLDETFGLDAEAMKAAQRWRFRPGTRHDVPVPVWVTIELIFSLR